MKILVLFDPTSPGGIATQGALLYRGLKELGVDVCSVHFEASTEKEWYYRWFKPDIVVGIGYWGHTPHIVLHPKRYGVQPVPWLIADGYVANYHEILNSLPLILVTSNWVKETYMRDGIKGDNIEVLPIGCDTNAFTPMDQNDSKVQAVRNTFGIPEDQLMLLTVGGDAASKGAQEVMQALALIDRKAPDWKYICKVWPQARTKAQNLIDLQMATHLGIDKNMFYSEGIMSRYFMPYLLAACDIYVSPSRLEGFGMPAVEANSCGKPVLAINAMGFLDTMKHGKTAFLANVATQIVVNEAIVGEESGYEAGHRVLFNAPRTVDFRASVYDIADYLLKLMEDADLRKKMGEAGRKRVAKLFDYKIVAEKFVEIVSNRLGIS